MSPFGTKTCWRHWVLSQAKSNENTCVFVILACIHQTYLKYLFLTFWEIQLHLKIPWVGINEPLWDKSLVGFGLNEPLWNKSLVGFVLNHLKIAKTIMFYRAFMRRSKKSLVGLDLNKPLWDKTLIGCALNRLKVDKTSMFYRVFMYKSKKSLVGFDLNEPLWDKVS